MVRDLRDLRRGASGRTKSYWYRGRNALFDRSRPFQHPYPALTGLQGTSSLDLGCGPGPQNPFGASSLFGVDVQDYGDPRICVADLAVEPIPFEDKSFDFVTAFDFFEHIPRLIYLNGSRRSPFIELMNEIHRVLKHGGLLYAQTPAYPYSEAFGDPTHVNPISKATVEYFTDPKYRELAGAYGFSGRFELLDQYWHRQWYYHLIWQLTAVHDE